MVDLSLIEPGMQVRIIDHWVPGCCQNSEGQMDRWLGKIMTVKCRQCGHLSMMEDGGRWAWSEHTIAEIIDNTPLTHVEDLL